MDKALEIYKSWQDVLSQVHVLYFTKRQVVFYCMNPINSSVCHLKSKMHPNLIIVVLARKMLINMTREVENRKNITRRYEA